MAKLTPAERYGKQGLVAFQTWVDPELILKIKTIALMENKTIREVLADRFSDMTVEKGVKRVTVKFSKEKEEA